MLQSSKIAQFGQGLQPPTNAFSEGSTNDLTQSVNAFTNLEYIVSNVIAIITALASLLFIYYFITAAISWITSGGDSGKLTTARNQMLNAVLGLVLLVASYAIIGLVGTLFGLDLLNPGKVLKELVPTP